MSCSAAEFHLHDIINIIVRQYGEALSVEQVQAMNQSIKVSYLKRNLTVARQIDYIFKHVWGKIILSDMHLIWQILNFDDRRDYQGRATEHFHTPLHTEGAPKLEDEDSKVIELIDQYITCSLPNQKIFRIE